MTRVVMTVCYVLRDKEILLGLKKRRLGKGFWNGFGGRVEVGESIEEAAVREVTEEAGIVVKDLTKVAILEFVSQARAGETLEVHFFTTHAFSGEPQESDEMKPKWFPLDSIPFAKMWSSDPYLFPYMLEGKKCRGRFIFAPGDVILEHHLEEVLTLTK